MQLYTHLSTSVRSRSFIAQKASYWSLISLKSISWAVSIVTSLRPLVGEIGDGGEQNIPLPSTPPPPPRGARSENYPGGWWLNPGWAGGGGG